MSKTKAPKRADGSYSRAWRNVSKIILRPGIRVMMAVDWHGQDMIPREGGFILAANHLSYMDVLAISLFADSARRYPVFLAKASLFKMPVLGYLLRNLGQLPVNRGSTDAALVLRDSEVLARAGACVIFYPESTVTRDPDKWPMVAKTGVARLALTTGLPVIPVATWGAQDILPYGNVVPRVLPRKTVKVVAGPPVDLSEFAGQDPTPAVLRAATDKVMRSVAGLLGELRGEEPPAEFFHPAVARRKLRQDLRALAQGDDGQALEPAAAAPADPEGEAAGQPEAPAPAEAEGQDSPTS